MPEDNRLSHLLDYTTFHIGIYISLVTALIGLGIFKENIGDSFLLKWSIALITLAGICGGIVGSNIPPCKTYDEYWQKFLGYWKLKPFKPEVWIALEHLFFWLGVLPLSVGYLLFGAKAFG